METEIKDVLKCLRKRPLLRKFAKWLYENEYCGVEEIEALLCEAWEGAYPEGFLGENLLVTIGNFLYYMAEFVVEKIYGEDWWKTPGHIKIVPYPSYEDRSYVYILELETKTILAIGCRGKTWNYDPETVEEDLEDLESQLKETKKLLAVRRLTSS